MSRQEKGRSFLSSLMARPGKKNIDHQKYAGGDRSLPRPHSQSDFTEAEEYNIQFFESLNEEEFDKLYEKMLDDMNLSEEKKEPLRSQPMKNKLKLISIHYKDSKSSNNKLDKPIDYINFLQQSELSISKIQSCLENLRISLTNNPLSWVQEFGDPGLKCVLTILNTCYKGSSKYDRIQYECLRCLNAIMNNTAGLKRILSHGEALILIARSLDPQRSSAMLEACKILAAICIIPEGHEKILEAITMASEMGSTKKDRFTPIIRGLMIKNNEYLRIACMQLINALVQYPDELDFRIHLRNEMLRCGLSGILPHLTEDAGELLELQLNIFKNHKDEDSDEFIQRYDNLKVEMEDPNECYEVIKNLVMDTPAEPYFLSILQHLLLIRDDVEIRPAYFKLIEECVTQIVLHKAGLDPDFSSTKRFNIEIEPLLDGLIERSKAEESNAVEQVKLKLEEALAQRQEAEAKLQQMEQKLKQLETGGPPKFIPPPPPAMLLKGPSGMGPPPPPMPGMGPPSVPGIGAPPPPPMPGMGGPPPPPMPGMGGPPPPPMPGMGAPPPPMFPGMGPPGFPGVFRPVETLPYGLKPKHKWEVGGPLKRANWKAIVPQKMSEKSFWVNVKEEQLGLKAPDILEGLAQKFSTKAVAKKSDDHLGDKPGSGGKKVKELKVLDGKAAQNLSILLGGSLKHLSYNEVKKCVLQCNTEVLPDSVLQQLIQYLPPPDQLKKLQEYKSQYNDLTEAEQFAVTLSDVKRLLPRLKSLSFKLRQSEMVLDIKPQIVAANEACEEVMKSKKFAKILELILLMGNYMNSGSKNEAAFGFEISYLPKLSGTKDIENRMTLLHYLVDTIEKKFPELLTFSDELEHVDRAARVNVDQIGKNLRTMDSAIKNLETDLNNNKEPQGDDDKFCEVMAQFAIVAREQCSTMHGMFEKMNALFKDIAEFYAFDPTKYTLEEFFTDIKSFKDSFISSHQDNIKQREAEEKAERVAAAKVKAEQERAQRAAHKRALVDMNTAQEGVMDSLLEALNTGSAFAREQRRRRQPRPAGAERRAQLSRSRSRSGIATNAITAREIVNALGPN